MTATIPNPYTGKEDQTCSVSFAAQQDAAAGVGSPQTEAQYNKSKLLGEIGVIKAKLAKGEIPDGTKLLVFEGVGSNTSRGYLYSKGKKVYRRTYRSDGSFTTSASTANDLELYVNSPLWKASIPQAAGHAAAPTHAEAVNSGSGSVGSMSHEDVAAMFVKIKDDLAKQKGLNIKGSNPGLDEEVYKAIGATTGYTPAEVKAKIDAYKADGNKLSALKKKVFSGSKKVPDGQPQPTKAPTPGVPLTHPRTKPVLDPKPNGVPTVATPKITNEAKQTVLDAVRKDPKKHYTDEDVAAAYIIAKDKIVAESNGKWTIYSKSDEMDKKIAEEVGLKTGLNPLQQKQAIANYLASGKRLSQLKKSLEKQGAFTRAQRRQHVRR